MRLAERKYNIHFTIVDCCDCGMLFGVPRSVNTRWEEAGETHTFYCPAGHPQHYVGKSDEQRAKEAEAALKQERKRREWAEHNAATARNEAQRSEYSRRAEKAAKTRIKNRIGKGVCIHCNRSFSDLRRHMASKHPDYAATD